MDEFKVSTNNSEEDEAEISMTSTYRLNEIEQESVDSDKILHSKFKTTSLQKQDPNRNGEKKRNS